MTDSLRGVRTRPAQNKPRVRSVSAPARADQVANNGGGYGFGIDKFEQAKRFLILGSEANFYRSGAEMSKENAGVIFALAADDKTSAKLVDLIVEISTQGRAPKQNPAIFALAIAASTGSTEAKRYALSKLNEVARTGTTLFLFASYVAQFRGWGSALKKAIAGWYTNRSVEKLAFQTVKYQSREGYTHGDLARLSHPSRPNDEAFNGLMKWAIRGDATLVPAIVEGFNKAKVEGADIPALVREYGLSWEMLPTQSLNEVSTWEALLEKNLPLGALLRQLPRLTRIGFFAPFSDNTRKVVDRLTDEAELGRARIHPINLLVALRTYSAGRSERGSGTWTPSQDIVDALDKAFYLAFKTIEPSGKNTLVGVDVSGSMSWGGGYGANLPGGLSPAEIAGALSLVIKATEKSSHIAGFASSVVDLKISPRDRLDAAFRKVQMNNFGSTNPGALIEYAIKNKLPVETFIVITDNDVNTGSHVYQLLQKYRKTSGIPARMIVMATTASNFTIADPKDPLSLDVAGFDSATPALVADFSRGL